MGYEESEDDGKDWEKDSESQYKLVDQEGITSWHQQRRH